MSQRLSPNMCTTVHDDRGEDGRDMSMRAWQEQAASYPPEWYEQRERERFEEQERNQERADMVREAQEKIIDAIDMIEQAIRGHDYEDNWDAYVVAHLKIIASDDHGYVSRDTTLDDIIRKLEGREDEEGW